MRNPLLYILLLLFSCQNQESNLNIVSMSQTHTPPVAAKKNKELSIHAHTRIDPYYWLNERENQEVIDYLEAENEYTQKVLAHTEGLQEDLYNEIVGRIKKDDESVPYKDNGYFYYTRYESEGEHPIYCRKKGNLDQSEEIMLNVNELAEGYDFYYARGLNVDPQNQILAFGEDTLSRRIYTMKFKDLQTGDYLPDVIENTEGYIVWSNDSKYIYYTRKDETLRPHKVFRHKLGSSTDEDVEIWHESDPTFLTYIYKTKSKDYLVIGSYSTLTESYQILKADNPTGKFVDFATRSEGIEYGIYHHKDKWFIRTNYKAKNFRLMEANVGYTTMAEWKEIIPNRQDILLEGIDIFDKYLVLQERIKGITNLKVMPTSGDNYIIDFGSESYLASPFNNYDFDTDILRLSFTSMNTPWTTYDFNMQTREFTQLKQQEVVGGYNVDDYVTERRYAKARDGVEVPLSIVYKKGFEKNGSKPLLLYAYGSYGSSMDPYFSSVRLSLLDRGFCYVIAHIRGGQELGRQWYEDGKLLKKKNTFNDFIDCANYLIENDYTSADHLYAMGGSAGGLLMGAIVNMAPETFNGVIAAVPFVDVITTMLDESIPLTTGEYDEWGNPNDKEYYDYILSYSPYDQVSEQEYPSMLVTTGLHDSQVQYWEPAKWVAKLRTHKTDQNPLLLHTNMSTGHSGSSGRFERHKETALEYAFLLDLENITDRN